MARIEDEFVGSDFGDPRRAARLARLSAQMAESPDRSFPDVLDEGQLEGAYRFFSNPRVTFEGIISPHIRATWQRAGEGEVTLAVHDTTRMSFRAFGKRIGVPTTTRGSQQFHVHATLAVEGDATRRPQGLLALTTHDQQDIGFHQRWLDHVHTVEQARPEGITVVHVMDREADDYELLAELVGTGRRFVIRAQHDRRVKDGRLFSAVGTCEIACVREAQLSARRPKHRSENSKQLKTNPPREHRRAKLGFAATRIEVPRTTTAPKTSLKSIELHVVRAWELEPPPGEKPIEWVLLTTEPIDGAAAIERIVDWYRARWVVEEYFKALKTGCAYEQRQLETFHALRNALGLFAPLAWRLLLLRTEARDRPAAPATHVVTDTQIKVLRAARRSRLPQQPTTRDVWLAIARLGGHLPRNGDPGWLVLARGFQKLETLTAGWSLRNATESCDQS